MNKIVATLFDYRVEMAAAFRIFDTDGDGTISRDEFRQGLAALRSLSGDTITDMQCDEMMKALDRDGSGTIEYQEFVDAFKIVDGETTAG